jgi:hypothetical protein
MRRVARLLDRKQYPPHANSSCDIYTHSGDELIEKLATLGVPDAETGTVQREQQKSCYWLDVLFGAR